MCGVAGFLGGPWPGDQPAVAILERMNRSIHHRGPDHSDTWVDASARIGFAFSRLAIVDLSPAGNQPMASHSGRYVIVFNGEIYNHRELRERLESVGGRSWRGHSDTETFLEAIEEWGIQSALQATVGMFAFALWDRAERRLVVARDRIGEKPIYYGRLGGAGGPFVFGSELKPLTQHPAFSAEVDRQALALLLRYNYIPAPFSIYRGIKKLEPGTFLTVDSGTAEPHVTTYWSGTDAAESGLADPLQLTPDEAVDTLEHALERAIAGQMVADVPLGAFLSGGIDSSAVVALMQKLSTRPVKTFTIGFNEDDYNEANHAKAVARHLGTEHTELYVTPSEARRVIPKLPDIYDEPFADSSQIPTHLVSALARQHVAVALSGDGGDELFGGYTRYRLTARLWNKLSSIPGPLRAAAAKALLTISPAAWTKLGNMAGVMLPRSAQVNRLGEKIHKGAPLLCSRSISELYGSMLSLWSSPGDVVIGADEPPSQATGHMPKLAGLGPIERMMAMDMVGYLPGDILAKVDRAAMAVSLETRVPYLDHRVVELAWRLPLEFKIRRGETKWVLRQLLFRHVPRALMERPKMGFGVPIGDWLRGPLRDWAEALLDTRRLTSEGFFHPRPIEAMWHAHLSGRVNEQYRLWTILMFQSWLESKHSAYAGDHRPHGSAYPVRSAGYQPALR